MVFPILWYRLRIPSCFVVFVVGTDANAREEGVNDDCARRRRWDVLTDAEAPTLLLKIQTSEWDRRRHVTSIRPTLRSIPWAPKVRFVAMLAEPFVLDRPPPQRDDRTGGRSAPE
jgi:hypothetical protein